MKKLVKIAVVLVLLLVVAVVGSLLYIDRIARIGIERGGTFALGVPTTLDRADVGVFSGEFAMSGLRVANPAGFEGSHFLTLAEGGVAVDLGTLRQETVELPRLHLSGIDVVLDRRGGTSNYETILANLKRLESGARSAEDPAPDSEEETRFTVHEVRIRDLVVHVNLLASGGELTQTRLAIDEVALNDVGSDTTGGMLLSELWGVIVKAVFEAIVEKGDDIIPREILGTLQSGLAGLRPLSDLGIDVVVGAARAVGDVTDGVGKGLEGVADVAGGAADAVGGIGAEAGNALEGVAGEAEKALKGLGGLLGGETDEPKGGGG